MQTDATTQNRLSRLTPNRLREMTFPLENEQIGIE